MSHSRDTRYVRINSPDPIGCSLNVCGKPSVIALIPLDDVDPITGQHIYVRLKIALCPTCVQELYQHTGEVPVISVNTPRPRELGIPPRGA